MSPRHNDIHTLERAILAQAEEEAASILEDAQEQAKAIREQAQTEIEAECHTLLEHAQEEAQAQRSHIVAAAQMEAHTLKLRRREKILRQVFDESQRRITEILHWPNYHSLALELIREAAQRLEADELVVHADPETHRLIGEDSLAQLAQELGVQLSFGDDLTTGVGVSVETTDGHRRYDNRLEARLERLQESLRTPVYHILMGESYE